MPKAVKENCVMTFDEIKAHENIRHTMAIYNHAGDTDDAETYADTFANDAIFENPGYFRLVGRDAILAWKKTHRVFTTAEFRMHNVSSILINMVGPNSANVRSNWIAITNAGPDHAGRYIDRFIQTNNGWKIAERTVEMLWISKDSLLQQAVPGK